MRRGGRTIRILPIVRAPSRESSSFFAPVTTILPDRKTSAVALGSRSRMMTAAKRCGLYSALRACVAMCARSGAQRKSVDATQF